jgi:FkbM family methyltransferase
MMIFSRAFTAPALFAAREIRGSAAVRPYALRDSPIRVYVRHGTPDVNVVGEILIERVYETPAPVAEVLDDLRRPLRILDLGANIGLFGAFALRRWPDARVIAFEPDPSNIAIHRLTVSANAFADWRVEWAAAANENGQLTFATGQFNEGTVMNGDGHGSDQGHTVPAVDVLPLMADADLVKVDIEGSEWALLTDGRFADVSPRALVLEYHSRGCPGPDSRSAAQQTLATVGYETLDVPLPPGACPGQGMLWAWRSGG